MKLARSLLGIVLAGSLALAAACSKDEKDNAGDNKPTAGADAGAKVPAPDKPAPDAAPAVKGALAPSAVDPETPIPIDQLADSLAVLDRGTTFKIVGYPSFFLGDKRAPGSALDLAAEPGQKNDKAVIKCRLAEASKDELSNTELVEVTGVLDGTAMAKGKRHLRMSKCAIVGKADAYPKDAPIVAGGDAAVAAGTLTDFYYSWLETEVSVVGDFWGVTTSKNNKTGEVIDIRADIKGAGKKRGGCHLEAEPAKLTGDARKGVVFRGTFNGYTGKQLQLEPCKLANR